MRIELSRCVLRTWEIGDREALARHANDLLIWRHLRDRFPYPYTLADADAFLSRVCEVRPETSLAIDVNGESCGGISVMLQSDVHRYSGEIGYWLGREYWGRGIMTEAVGAFTDSIFERFGLMRVYALPFDNNPASAKLLEKCGFQLEGRMRKSAVKEGVALDQLIFAMTK